MRGVSQQESRRGGGCRFLVAGCILFVVALAMLAAAPPLLAQDQVGAKLDALVAAYPNALASHDVNGLRWRDGTAMPVSGGGASKTFAELLQHASIIDTLRIPYPRGPLEKPPVVDADPGC